MGDEYCICDLAAGRLCAYHDINPKGTTWLPKRQVKHSMRQFDTGATRDTDTHKYDYEGFLSPLVLERFAQYMHKHRVQADGSLRASDNWQKGIPLDAYMKSGWRHFMELWTLHRGDADTPEERAEALCALMFNTMGYLHELLKDSE